MPKKDPNESLQPSQTHGTVYRFNDVLIDRVNFRVLKNGEVAPLSPRAFDVLLYLVEQRGRVIEKNELFEAVWKDTFVSDNALTKVVKTIRAALGDDVDAPKYIETVPKRGYRFIASVNEENPADTVITERTVASITMETETTDELPIGFIDTEAVAVDSGANKPASVTELITTKPGNALHTTSGLHRAVVQHARLARWWKGIALALTAAILLLGGLWYWRSSSSSTRSVRVASIAVMPFIVGVENSDVEYLADGLTEALIDNLSRLPRLSVKARSIVFRYRGKSVDPQTAGRELGVEAVLLSRLVQRGDNLELSSELVETATGNHLWGTQYTRKADELMRLQTEITRDISITLKASFSSPEEQRQARNYPGTGEAYHLYLRGRYHWNKRNSKDVRKSIEYFQQAIKVDPNYALAYTGLGDAYSVLGGYGEPPAVLMPKAREAALKALSLDDQLAEAYTLLGYTLSVYDYEFASAEQQFKRAIELNPNYATGHQYYGELLTHRGRFEEAVREFHRALELEPFSLIINRMYGESLYFSRRYDESIAQFKKTMELDPNFARVHYSLAAAYQMKRDYATSIEEFARFQELAGSSSNATLIRESFARGGWQAFLRAMTDERRPVEMSSSMAARFYADLGEKDKAIAELNRAYLEHEGFLVWMQVDPRLDPLRDDPRFMELQNRVATHSNP